MIDDTNKIKEKNNIQIEHLMNEINRLKRESEVMNVAYNELKTHYDQMQSKNQQYLEVNIIIKLNKINIYTFFFFFFFFFLNKKFFFFFFFFFFF